MTETIDVANASRSDLFLPCGTKVPAGASTPVAVASLQAHRDNPVVRHWLDENLLVPAEPIPEPEAGYEIVEKPRGKFNVLIDGQPMNHEPFATRAAAEAFAKGEQAEG